MSSTPVIFQLINPIMKTILKSPFHGMISRQIMIITFSGAKSGKLYSTPVSYSRKNAMVNCFTHAKWWKNFASKPEVKMRIQGEDLNGTAQAITDDIDMISAGLEKHLMAVPNDARFYNVKLDDYSIPNKLDVQKAAAECVMVQISLLSNP